MGEYYLRKCLDLLEKATPIKHRVCGKQCLKRCCGGGLNDAVFLFPGEREQLSEDSFEFLKTEANYGFDALLCGGKCNRKHRPLGCRIFPLFPLATEVNDGIKICVVFDPRAIRICPLSKNTGIISHSFIRSVKRAGEYMLLDEEMRNYLLALSEELREYAFLDYKLGCSNKKMPIFTVCS